MAPSKRAIYLLGHGEDLVEMREAAYESEDLLQRLLATHPNLLAGDQMDIEAPRRWLLIDREASVPGEQNGSGRWSVDHLFLDQDGVPTLVEVKRSTDTRIRREVVGQMLDYAANAVVYWPLEHLRAQFAMRCSGVGRSPEDELGAFLGPGGDQEKFWQQAKTNLQAGRVRMVFVADEIPTELRRIVEFLNEQMDPAEVLAVEIKQYEGSNLKTLVPIVIGRTEEASQRKGGGTVKRQWDEGSFFVDLAQRRNSNEVAAARRVVDWCRAQAVRIWWGRGGTYASFIPILDQSGVKHRLFNIASTGVIEIYFSFYAEQSPFSDEGKRRELMTRLNRIEGIALTEADINRRPSVQLALFTDESRLAAFLDCFRWFLAEVRSTQT